MKSRGAAIVIVVSVAAVAFFFMAPMVPFSFIVRNGFAQPTTSITCSPRPGGILITDAPGFLYEGYKSISQYFIGIGITVYVGCYSGY